MAHLFIFSNIVRSSNNVSWGRREEFGNAFGGTSIVTPWCQGTKSSLHMRICEFETEDIAGIDPTESGILSVMKKNPKPESLTLLSPHL